MPHEIKQPKHQKVDLSESSVYGRESTDASEGLGADIASQSTIQRLEEITGEVNDERERDNPNLYQGRLGRAVESLDASTDEEIDALELDLTQDDARANDGDGSGRVVDDVAEERLAEFTEAGPDLDEEGALSVDPGSEDTSATLRRHHRNSESARTDAIVEGNAGPGDEPRDETLIERKTDKGPGA